MGCSQKKCCKHLTVSLVPVTALVLALVFFCGIIALPILYEELTKYEKFGIVIDAGSRHTEVFVYKWRLPGSSNVPKNTWRVNEVYNCPGDKGISSYTADPQDAGKAFKACLDVTSSQDYVPKSTLDSTHVYLGATAGMRMLEHSDPALSEKIMEGVRSTLINSSYSHYNASIITGQQEGSSAWLSINYLLGNLRQDSIQNLNTSTSSGALDMGGASMQIAFLPSSPSSSFPKQYGMDVTLYKKTIRLYSRTYLCYGMDEALRRLLAHLAAESSSDNVINNPCLPIGANSNVTSSYLNSSCTTGDAAMDVFGSALTLPVPSFPNLRNENSYLFKGTGNYSQCLSLTREVFNFTRCEGSINSTRNVCVNGTDYFYPPVEGKYVAMDGFYYVFKEIAPWLVGNKINISKLNNFSDTVQKKYCHTLKEAENNSSLCFSGIYIDHVLEKGFGLNKSRNWTIEVKSKINEVTLDWSLGYMLNKTGFINTKDFYVYHPYDVADLVVGMVMLSILCVVFVVFFLFTFFACKNVLRSRNGYASLA